MVQAHLDSVARATTTQQAAAVVASPLEIQVAPHPPLPLSTILLSSTSYPDHYFAPSPRFQSRALRPAPPGGKPELLSSGKPSKSSGSLRSSEISARARDRCTRVHSRMMQKGRESVRPLLPLTTIIADLRPLRSTIGCIRVPRLSSLCASPRRFWRRILYNIGLLPPFWMLRHQTLIADSLTNSRNRIIPCKKFISKSLLRGIFYYSQRMNYQLLLLIHVSAIFSSCTLRSIIYIYGFYILYV